jgi:hypothetical protein
VGGVADKGKTVPVLYPPSGFLEDPSPLPKGACKAFDPETSWDLLSYPEISQACLFPCGILVCALPVMDPF